MPKQHGEHASHPFKALLTTARRQGNAAGMFMLNQRAYQFVVVPVKAPRLIAWAGMGFEVNHQLAERLAAIAGVSVDFVVRENGRSVFHTAAGRSEPGATEARAQQRAPAFVSARHVMLASDDTEFGAVLSLSRDAVLSP